jgi:membrane complex biogenesis BtpA family protein
MNLFSRHQRLLLGMVHLGALPGTPAAGPGLDSVVERAVAEATQLLEAGFGGVILENMHDRPYVRREVGPEITAAMTRAAVEVRRALGPTAVIGVQILAGANREAIAVARSANLDFVRAEGFVFAHTADEGIFESDAAELLRYRRAIGADAVEVFVDIKKKHSSHAITADVSLTDTAHAAEFFLADGVIVTGSATGQPTDAAEVAEVAAATALPVLVGSGITPANLGDYLANAAGLIVGSYLKEEGDWRNGLDPARCRGMVNAYRDALQANGMKLA